MVGDRLAMANKEGVALEKHANIDQFAADLAKHILSQSVKTLQNYALPTCSVSNELNDESSHWVTTDCSDVQDVNSSENEISSKDTDTHTTELKLYAQELCCDIINGALQTFDNLRDHNISGKCELISSPPCDKTGANNFSTERTEIFHHHYVRPTIVISSSDTKQTRSGTDLHQRNKKKKTRYKRKLDKELAKLKPVKSNNKFLSTIEETPPVDDIDDPGIVCAVCLDFYFHPYACKPCDHKFCEPCLRRLAKYSSDAGKITSCPICREPVHHCQKDFDLSEKIKTRFPDDYRRRRNTDAHSKYMNHPLPSQPTQTVDSAIISHIIRRRRLERQRFRNPLLGYTPARIDFRRYISLAVFIVIIKALALMVIVAVYNAVLVE